MPQFHEEFDWIVVGSGAGSMSSALVMRQAGKSVLILEKSAWFGGTTAKSGGVMWVPNNTFMRKAGISDTPEAAQTYLDTLCGDSPNTPGTSRTRRQSYIKHAPLMVDFLINQGIELEKASAFWPDYYDDQPGGCSTTRTVCAAPFDAKKLGPWRKKLRAGFMPVPARFDEAGKIAFLNKSWKNKAVFSKIVLRVIKNRLLGRDIVSAGAALQGRLLQAALQRNVDIRLETPVSELLMEKGTIVGVVALVCGKPQRIKARLGVLVNAGGFAQNQAMRDQYLPGTETAWSNAIESDTGEMMLEMKKHGGILAQMDQIVGFPLTRAPGWEKAYVKPPVQNLTGKPHAILVDQSGVRYLDEGSSYEHYCEEMRKRDSIVGAVPSWAVFDAQYIDQYMLANTFPGRKKPKSWAANGYLKTADTIEDLAAQLNINATTLKHTIDRWNSFVDANCDSDFHRGERAYSAWLGDPYNTPNPSLGRIDKAPYYAVDVVPGDVSTYGGIVTDTNGCVVDSHNNLIAGLYATGTSTASVMGGVYPGAGSSIGPSLTFGYLAALHTLATQSDQKF